MYIYGSKYVVAEQYAVQFLIQYGQFPGHNHKQILAHSVKQIDCLMPD